MIGVIALLVLAALILTLVSTTGRVPLWVAVLVLCLVELLQVWPGGR